ncbi:hypothetical protein NXS19_006627 [Fusarium pseudograminearum]|nr:hypothetical protein NXS19_006627 [Fusarium pseudograminearum]
MAESGVAHKVISVILRLSELASAIIVLGILSRLTYLIEDRHIHLHYITVAINSAGYASWRTVLSFSFIAWFLHLLSGILGVYVFHTYIKLDETKRDIQQHAEKLVKPDPRARGYDRSLENQTGETVSV